MKSKSEILQTLKSTGVVAVIRAQSAGDLADVGRALRAGGVQFLEITMTVPGALGAVEKAVSALQDEDVNIGVGTVLDAETARLAILAGAQYIVTPVFRPSIVETCRRYGVAVMPGAFSPTEVLGAWEAGGDVVKIFPAGTGGPQYFKDLQGPLGHIDLMPTGGVNRETAPRFIRAGACAVGVGGELASKELIAARDYDTITKNAADFITLVAQAKKTAH